jgi:hypothetical protein
MPLFFLIAIGLGAATLGATTVDVTTDNNNRHTAQAQQVQKTQALASDFNAGSYRNRAECVQAASQHKLPASVCPSM